MPISDELKTNNKIDYKQKYINLKRKLKLLIYENESYAEELRKSERQLLQVSRDKSYLLDRLLQYEKVESSTSDSEDTVSSDSEVESRKFDAKKKKLNETNESQSSSNTSRKKKTTTTASATRSRSSSTGKLAKTQSMATQVSGCTTSSTSMTTSTMTMPLIKSELSLALSQTLASCSQSPKASVSSTSSINSTVDGHMTSEELERHLESRRQPSALLMPEKTPLTVPVELFSNESSNGLPEDDNHINLKLNS